MRKITISLLVLTMFLLAGCKSPVDTRSNEQSEAGSKLPLQIGYLSYISAEMADGLMPKKRLLT